MNDPSPAGQNEQMFREIVLPAELAEIARRRKNAEVRPIASSDEGAAPSTSFGLVGLAFLGGGIRSASFCLGVVQRLIASDVFKHVDYLSTVSGGGYTGSCLSALMRSGRDGERLLVRRDSPALNHVRNGSNYLIPDGFFNFLRLPAVIFVGALHTLLLMLPVVVLAVFFTEGFFELTGRYLPFAVTWVPVIGVVPLLLALLLRPALTTVGWGRTWKVRDQAGRRLAKFLLLVAVSSLALPVLLFLHYLVNSDPKHVFDSVQGLIAAQLDLAFRGRGWLLWGGAATAGLLAFSVRRWGARLVAPAVGVAGPLVVVGVYLLACLYVINSPVVPPNEGEPFVKAVAARDFTSGNNPSSALDKAFRDAAEQVLVEKRMSLADYGVPAIVRSPSDDIQLVVKRPDTPAWWWRFTTYFEPQLTIHLQDSDCLRNDATKPKAA